MKTSFWICALLLAAFLSCERREADVTIRRSQVSPHHDGGRRGADSTGEASVTIPGHGIFLTAVDYPAGYDWRRDTARGEVRGRLLLLRVQGDGRTLSGPVVLDTILRVEAGRGRAVSLDPDRHHFTGGHLLTECITEVGTVYSRDGRVTFISREREYVRGILARDEDLYVLSQRLDSGGFILRRNWKPVLSRETGQLHGSLGNPAFARTGALFEDRGQVCFFYTCPAGEPGEWFLVRDGKEQAVDLPSGITQLHDIRCRDGVLCLLSRWRKREPVLHVGTKRKDLSMTFGTPARKSGFHFLRPYDSPGTDGGDLFFSGNCRLEWNQRLYTSLWSSSRLQHTYEGRCDFLSPEAWMCRRDGQFVVGTPTEQILEGDWTVMMPSCAQICDGTLYLALSRYDGTPALWSEGRVHPIPLNGCLTSVTVLP